MATTAHQIPHSAVDTVKTFCQAAVQTGQLSRDHLNRIVKSLRVSAADRKETASLFTTAKVAELYGCSKRTVLRMAQDGRLTPVYLRPGNAKSLRFRAKEVFAISEGVEV